MPTVHLKVDHYVPPAARLPLWTLMYVTTSVLFLDGPPMNPFEDTPIIFSTVTEYPKSGPSS